MIRVQGVVANIPGRHPEDRYSGRFCYLSLKAVEMSVNGFGLPSCIGEDRIVDLRESPFCRECEQCAGLYSGSEGKARNWGEGEWEWEFLGRGEREASRRCRRLSGSSPRGA